MTTMISSPIQKDINPWRRYVFLAILCCFLLGGSPVPNGTAAYASDVSGYTDHREKSGQRGSEKKRDAIIYTNGVRYEGEVLNGLPHGMGVFTKPNGYRYEGRTEKGIRAAGKAKITFSGGGVSYEGQVAENGVPHGKGTMTQSGIRFYGDWIDSNNANNVAGNEGRLRHEGKIENGRFIERVYMYCFATFGNPGDPIMIRYTDIKATWQPEGNAQTHKKCEDEFRQRMNQVYDINEYDSSYVTCPLISTMDGSMRELAGMKRHFANYDHDQEPDTWQCPY